MLQKLSDGARGGLSKFILVGFLFMAVLGLVLTDVGGFFRDGISSTNVAEVGRESVPYNQFDRYLRNTLSRAGITPQDAYPLGQVHDILNRYIQDILFVQAANDLGIRIPNKEVASQLHNFISSYQDEDTSPQQALDRFLATQGLSESDFVNALRKSMTANLLQQALLSGTKTAARPLSDELARYRNETRDIHFIEIPHKSVQLDAQPTEEELKNFYDLSRAEYRIPERRSFTLAILNAETALPPVTITDEAAKVYYDENQSVYEVPAGRKVEQAIFGSENEALSTIEKIKTSDISFKDAAGEAYRGEQIYQEESTPTPLKEIIFGSSDTSIKGPVETPFGWQVFYDQGDVATSVRPFNTVKDTIKSALKRAEESKQLLALTDEINDLIDEGASFDTLATTYKMETVTLGPVDHFGLNEANQDGLKSFEKDSADLLDTAFGLYEDEFSDILELQDGRFAILKINVIAPEDLKPYDAVKAQLLARLIQNRQRSANQEAATTLVNQLDAKEVTFDKVATDLNLTIQHIYALPRTLPETTPSENRIPDDLKMRLFQMAPNEFIMGQNANSFFIAQSSNVKLDLPAMTEERARQDEQRLAIQVLSTYYDYLRATTPVTINQQLLDQLYGQSDN